MRCDDVRKSVTEGAPLDEAIRGHLGSCDACGEEFAALRALASTRPAAPSALRERVLSRFEPGRRASRGFPARAAAVLLAGLALGFAGGYAVKPAREVEKLVVKEVPQLLSDDLISNVGIAATQVYGNMVDVSFESESVKIRRIVVNPAVRNYEQWCPVARELKAISDARPGLIVYKKTY